MSHYCVHCIVQYVGIIVRVEILSCKFWHFGRRIFVNIVFCCRDLCYAHFWIFLKSKIWSCKNYPLNKDFRLFWDLFLISHTLTPSLSPFLSLSPSLSLSLSFSYHLSLSLSQSHLVIFLTHPLKPLPLHRFLFRGLPPGVTVKCFTSHLEVKSLRPTALLHSRWASTHDCHVTWSCDTHVMCFFL